MNIRQWLIHKNNRKRVFLLSLMEEEEEKTEFDILNQVRSRISYHWPNYYSSM